MCGLSIEAVACLAAAHKWALELGMSNHDTHGFATGRAVNVQECFNCLCAVARSFAVEHLY